jgi:hypothetical protein
LPPKRTYNLRKISFRSTQNWFDYFETQRGRAQLSLS